MENKERREAEIRKMVQQLKEKTRVLVEATSSQSYLGMPVEKRIETLQDLKYSADGLLNETIGILTAESYEKNREMITYCFTNLTNIGGQIDSAIKTLKTKATG